MSRGFGRFSAKPTERLATKLSVFSGDLFQLPSCDFEIASDLHAIGAQLVALGAELMVLVGSFIQFGLKHDKFSGRPSGEFVECT